MFEDIVAIKLFGKLSKKYNREKSRFFDENEPISPFFSVIPSNHNLSVGRKRID